MVHRAEAEVIYPVTTQPARSYCIFITCLRGRLHLEGEDEQPRHVPSQLPRLRCLGASQKMRTIRAFSLAMFVAPQSPICLHTAQSLPIKVTSHLLKFTTTQSSHLPAHPPPPPDTRQIVT